MLELHTAHLKSFWQDMLSLALVADAAVGHSFPLVPRMLLAIGSQLSSFLGTALGQKKTAASSEVTPLPGGQSASNDQSIPGIKAWPPCFNAEPLRKANPGNHLCANLHPRVCFMENQTFFSKAVDVTHDGPISNIFPRALTYNSRDITVGKLSPT